ncbi:MULTISPECIES: MurR/RpiR family transcriptional regulator [Paraclostridium]|uniref:MurR/RpiR family transcriptional regulator n=1 Tax=Paraclostridium bifermentans TaxID=1490 RepID=A0A5P3XIT9_PARBF|nr:MULTISPECIES: MurR/RpiR family transcriptional regulator [Paraclostridium]MCU9808766.1 MurR/RpiR family transcriptional regulator [Paraclostridium sp. AKS46]MDV8108851.1 MurR/RpiR family transcriptional regulator [Bacillus sp. BAU-SS-2023]EQK45982.1 helix-turn-helix domain, rpiR family protein [[Clostridium] bifermentans ATCC 19299] [Paraclostridium bifermentans ATCC 19299]MBZ6005012.1 MurR/RpiR family transcriptional regulator [Paraclostridium bifermentans]MCR1875467.1 MurR/RpiR family tra
MNILEYIKQNYEDFTDSEKLIADYLLSNNESIINLSAKEIGEITNTSAATLIRFSKKLGFESLNEMKLKLSMSLRDIKEKADFEYINKKLETTDIIYGIKKSIDKVMDKTVNLIQEEDLEKAIELLSKAKNIYIYSVGVSGLVGQDFYYKLSRINKRCIAHVDTHLQITSSILMEPEDVAVAISYSGTTKEVIKCVENANKNNVPVISITKASISNKLEDLSDITLKVPYVEKSLREGAMSSRISQLAIIDMLFIGMAKENIEEVENKLVATREAVKDLKL